jgi:transcription elongation factor
MSSVSTNLSSVSPAALPPVKLHSRGHKLGSQVESADDSTSNDALGQGPSGSTQNLFGTLMQSLEQVIGVQPSTTPATTAGTTTPATTAGTTTPATAASATTAASASTRCATASAANGTSTTAQQSTLLQNYLNNLSHKGQADASQSPKVAGSSISTNA